MLSGRLKGAKIHSSAPAIALQEQNRALELAFEVLEMQSAIQYYMRGQT